MKFLLLIVCLIFCQSCFFLTASQTKKLNQINSIKPIDIIIVPGLPLHDGQWSTLLKSRVLWSEFLYRKGITSNVLYSGNAVYTPWIEGSSMALYANQLGINSDHILIDTMAEHSTENLFYGYQVAKQKGFKTIAVASDPFQCEMLKKFARENFKETIYFLPIIYDSIRNKMQLEFTIDTSITKRLNFISLETRGYRERLKGTRGKLIKKD